MTAPPPINILLVDDNPANLLALEALLADLGQHLVCARSGAEALALLRTTEFALVLLDAQMPDLDGFATAQRIRTQHPTGRVPIIMFLSAVHMDPTYIAQGYAAGAVDYLVKPLNPAVLRAKVQIFLNLFQQTAVIRQLNADLQAANQALEADIALRRQVEAELRASAAVVRDLNATLEARVAERTAALEQEIAERERVEAQLRELVVRDPLTGVYNRRELDQVLAAEVDRARRYRRPLALILLDLDHFKAVNDTYGHPTGDEVLRRIAAHLQQQVRSTDRVARYGGEEFAILLPETSVRWAFRVAEKLRTEVAALPFLLPAREAAGPLTITLSAGVVGLRPPLDTAAQLLTAADSALYTAKHQGRNCTVPYTRIRSILDGDQAEINP